MSDIPKFKNIPQELKLLPQWVCFRLEKKQGEEKLAKIPYDPKTGRRAKTNDPKTWGTYDQAVKTFSSGKYDGIGFVFSKDDLYTGVDIDDCIIDGVIKPWAQKIINQMNSYSEFSLSGTGVHILVKAEKPTGRCRTKDSPEIYTTGRFFVVTGKHISGTPATIEKRQDELDKLYADTFTPESSSSKPVSKPVTNLSLSNSELIEKAMSAKNGAKFTVLWNGDISGYASASEADAALCLLLSFWTNKDHERIDFLFRQSGLMRDKWDRRTGEQTYGDVTITRAIAGTKETYKGKSNTTSETSTKKDEREKTDTSPSDKNEQTIIDDLNKKHAVIMLGGKCVVLNKIIDYTFNRFDITFSSPTDFKNFYANHFTSVCDGKNTKSISIGKLWFNHPNRLQYDGITFSPFKKTPGYYNLWQGFSVNPKEGDCFSYLEHIYANISNGNIEIYNYIIAWLANAIQTPEDRPGVSIVIRGGRGSGKGVFISEFGKLFGAHYLHLQHIKHVTSNFNAHLKNVLIIFIDEAFWAGDKAGESFLKSMITDEIIEIEPKGKDQFSIKNYVRLMFSSNEQWVVPAGLDERRFLILDIGEDRVKDYDYFKTIIDQMNNGGREALLYYLQHYDISKINLREVPQTKALLETKILSMKLIEQFWYSRLLEGKQTSEVIDWNTSKITVAEFYQEFIIFCGKRPYILTSISFGLAIKKIDPKIERKKITIDNNRPWCYFFSSLEESRKNWEKLTQSTDWEWNADKNNLPF